MTKVTYIHILELLPALPNLNVILTNQAKTEFVLHYSNGSRFTVSADTAQNALNALFLLLAPSSPLTHQIILVHTNIATTARLRRLNVVDAEISSNEPTRIIA